MDAQPKAPAGRRWMQFSLRTLLVAMLVVAAFFAGRMPMVRRAELAERQRDAAEEKAQQAELLAQQIQTQAARRWIIRTTPGGNQVQYRYISPARPAPPSANSTRTISTNLLPQQVVPPNWRHDVDAGMIFDSLESQQRWNEQFRAIDVD